MPSLNLILGYVKKDVNVLLSSTGLTEFDSLDKSKKGIKYSSGHCMRAFSCFQHSHSASEWLFGLFCSSKSNVFSVLRVNEGKWNLMTEVKYAMFIFCC